MSGWIAPPPMRRPDASPARPSTRLWVRRGVAFLLGVVLPWSLLSQLLGTILFGRSSPGGLRGALIALVALGLVAALSALSGHPGQTWAHRLLRLRVLNLSGTPVPRLMLAGRIVLHVLVDLLATLCLGFLWALWDKNGQTFTDKLMRTTVQQSERAPR